MHLFLLILLLSYSSVVFSVQSERFPTFEELKQTEALLDEGDYDSYSKLWEIISFTELELNSINKSNKETDLALAIIFSNEMDGEKFLKIKRGLKLFPQSPLILFLTINNCARDGYEKKYKHCDSELYTSFVAVNKKNMISYYVMAAHDFKKNNYKQAILNLKIGNKAANYNGFTKETFDLIRNKGGSLGFPEYISNYMAFLNFASIMYIKPIFEMCKSNNNIVNNSIRAECLKLGNRMEIFSKTIIEKAFGLAIQKKVFESSKSSQSEIDIIDNRREAIDLVSKESRKIPKEQISLADNAQFYTDLFTFGEIEAFENIIKKKRMKSVLDECSSN